MALTSAPICHSRMIAFCEGRNSVEVGLLSPSASHGDATQRSDWTSDRAHVFEAQRLSGLIYLNLVLRAIPLVGKVLQALKSQLMRVVGGFAVERLSFSYVECAPRMVIWVYTLGGLLALDDSEKLWFAERVVKVLKDAGIRYWEEYVVVLEAILWAGRLKERAEKGLWRKMQEAFIPDPAYIVIPMK